ncbi:uncharacterized protein LOC5568792 isoform X3 [Aedes aegypti]|uniref:Uncharacterized protein n=1 Tax=Aedes aegypti TaxID=7159 RepID=A0A6I8TF30_AEDAE|nr:uncharacterized protein LOC5568792 isoform X3 [Aedes aegypti]
MIKSDMEHPKLEITLSVDEENALTLYEELERTDINTLNLNVDCCCGLLRTSPFHQPKSKSNSRERLRADSGVSSDDEVYADSCSQTSEHNSECREVESDHGYDSGSFSGQTSYSSTTSSMIEDISDKIEEIGKLDTNIHSLMYKSVEVHNDILSLEATTNRLLADTKKLSDDLDDVRYLDELITILNGDIGPVIHREWPYQILFDTPIEEGTPVT